MNKKACIAAARNELQKYEEYSIDVRRARMALVSPVSDGQPKGQSFVNTAESSIVADLDSEHHILVIKNVLAGMRQMGEPNEMYAIILEMKYLQQFANFDIRKKLHTKLRHSVPSRTFNDYENEALWTFAMLHPSSDLHVKKS
ncbi:hypothetical protein [Furfurilactobacillus rossiae]|uniref:hypothetical protein n=1 Tax=Furfurilactobacillus rossiae TaxID=231049 RepID=UPI0015BCC66A|nr:hypothetical protein [Furfurilactobacillus rossiae]